MPLLRISPKGIATLTEHFEGCELKAYCKADGIWTIGFGHTGSVFPSMVITQEQADVLLRGDITNAENAVNKFVKIVLTQNEFDALVDFVFNVGITAFVDSTMLKLLNENNTAEAASQFDEWDHIKGKIVAGLLYRREAETNLFEEHDAA